MAYKHFQRITQYALSNSNTYFLTKHQQDSHDYLFFQCSFSAQVWSAVMQVSDLPSISPIWDDIMAWIVPISKSKSIMSVVGRLVLAATAYYVWQERNNRLYSKVKDVWNTLEIPLQM